MVRNRYSSRVPDWSVEIVVALLLTVAIYTANAYFFGIESDVTVFTAVVIAVVIVQSFMQRFWTETSPSEADS